MASSDNSERLIFLGIDTSKPTLGAKEAAAFEQGVSTGLETFYAKVRKEPKLAAFFRDDTHVAKAKALQADRWIKMASRTVDDNFFRDSTSVGRTHARIGLEPKWYLGSYAVIMEEALKSLVPALVGSGFVSRRKVEDAAETLAKLVKLVILDMDLGVSTYFEAIEAERNKIEQERSVARQLAESLEVASTAMEQITSTIAETAENARLTEAAADRLSSNANEGGDAVRKSVIAMRDIASKVEVVHEIARQTDLLALNAAVEAARAGQSGAGFAVVAKEVRKLAERASDAAKEINELTQSAQVISERAGSCLETLVPEITTTSERISAISLACGEQKEGVDRVTQSMMELRNVALMLDAPPSEAPSMRRGPQTPAGRVTKISRIRHSTAAE